MGRLPDGGLHRPRRPALAAHRRAGRAQRGRPAGRPASTLRFCRGLLALRRAELSGTIAAYTQLPGPPGVWVYRVGDLVVAANFTAEPACPGGLTGPLLLSTGRAAAGPGAPGPAGRTGRVTGLGPWEGVIVRDGGAVT